jgi:hypothetical protein
LALAAALAIEGGLAQATQQQQQRQGDSLRQISFKKLWSAAWLSCSGHAPAAAAAAAAAADAAGLRML